MPVSIRRVRAAVGGLHHCLSRYTEAEAEMFTAIQARAAERTLSFWFDQREDIYED